MPFQNISQIFLLDFTMPLYSTKMKKKKAKMTIFCGCEREKKQLEEVREWLYYEVLCLGKTSPSNK